MGRKRRARNTRALLGFALLFTVLGAGNLVVGHSRANEYREHLAAASAEIASAPALLAATGLPIPPENRLNRESQIRRLSARLDFYKTVIAGGKCFLGIAAFVLLFILVSSREKRQTPPH